ncbi:MAG: MFS transporter [Planctomycetia bacterium]|jgi:OPA family glycerol-3-phosphate transporter-like MFS transporter/OPA family sugar phosphate sensor protein UhpC-like MFS transporter
MKNFFNIIKTAPTIPQKNHEQLLRENYRYWRTRVLYTTTIGYAVFYLVRKGLSTAQPIIEKEFGFDKWQLGLILTLTGIAYGVSKFINGFAGDKTNPRYFMFLGLIGSAIINVFFGLSSGIIAFGIFWLLNGWFQGMGWAPCSRTLVQWFATKERGIKFSICNCAVSIGGASVMFLNGYLIKHYDWEYCFFIPAGIAVIGSLFILERLRDRPQSLGLPPVEEYYGDATDMQNAKAGDQTPYLDVVMKYMFREPMMWILCFANFFVYVIRYSIFDWGTTFLKECKGLEVSDGSWMMGGYELAGVAGMLLGGLIMDRIFRGYGGKACAIYMVLCSLFLVEFWLLPVYSIWANVIMLCSIGFLIYGPQCLIAVIAANMVPKNAGAAAVGFTGLFGYLSTSLSGLGLGIIVDYFGWSGGFLMLIISGAIGTVLFLILWNTGVLRVNHS